MFIRIRNRLINLAQVIHADIQPARKFRGEDWEPEVMTDPRVVLTFAVSDVDHLNDGETVVQVPHRLVLTKADAVAFMDWANACTVSRVPICVSQWDHVEAVEAVHGVMK